MLNLGAVLEVGGIYKDLYCTYVKRIRRSLYRGTDEGLLVNTTR